jgi:hypothetical protein
MLVNRNAVCLQYLGMIMKMPSLRHVLVFLMLIITASANAQTTNLYGDENQPGNRLHDQIMLIETAGTPRLQAIGTGINDSMDEDSTILGGEAKSAVAFDEPHTNAFYVEMVESNSLIEVIKVLSETYPDKVVHTITLGVVLYPDYAQDVFDGAALAGVMSSEDILVAVIQAGADPSTVSDATAGGNLPGAGSVPPIGPGVGGGGPGGGDTTASTN